MDSHCSHSKSRPRTAASLAAALGRAETLCLDKGGRWTRPRHKVMEKLLQAGAPVKAYDLMAGMGEGDAPAKPPTVYRALEFLEELGLVHRIASLNAYVACGDGHEGEGAHAAAFLLCDCCGSAEEFDATVEPTVDAAAHLHGFKTTSMVLEVHGRCRRCA
jgi:Fur family zinc uptake transcriptional regulator